MNKQQGFTLIELMIVVAIIGVLTTIAVPLYQGYIGRASFTSALSTLAAMKPSIENHILENGSFPTTADLTVEGLGITADSSDLGSITLQADGAGGGELTLTFAQGAPGINTRQVTLTRDNYGLWQCESDVDSQFVRHCEAVENSDS